jgi:anti-sigma B factor antagonist
MQQTATKVKVDRSTDSAGRPVTILRFAGDISSTSRDAVVGTYQGLPKDANPKILLDFTKVDYLNSSGIALIIQLLMEAAKSAQKVQIFGLTPHFQKVFKMVGITKYANLHPDEVTAKAAFN